MIHKRIYIIQIKNLIYTSCTLLQSYLTKRPFQLILEEAIIYWRTISAEVTQGSILERDLYSIYVTDIPNNNNSMTVMFADDTTVLTKCKN